MMVERKIGFIGSLIGLGILMLIVLHDAKLIEGDWLANHRVMVLRIGMGLLAFGLFVSAASFRRREGKR